MVRRVGTFELDAMIIDRLIASNLPNHSFVYSRNSSIISRDRKFQIRISAIIHEFH